MPAEAIYVYCVTDKEPKLNGAKDLVPGLYFVDEECLYAVVSKEAEDDFKAENLEKNLSNLDWVQTKAVAHEKVIEAVMREACVIPFKFATLFNTEKSLKGMLNDQGQKFKKKLAELTGKEEWGLKVYADKEKLQASQNIKSEELLMIDREISSASPGKGFLLKKKREELLNIAVNKWLNACSQKVFERLSERSSLGRINRLLPRDVTGRKEEMILNSSYLVPKDKLGQFTHEVDRLSGQHGLSFDLSGPWPPYNFAGLERE